MSLSEMSLQRPLRTTCAFVEVMTESLSMVRLLRISWKMPMAMLQRMTPMKSMLA